MSDKSKSIKTNPDADAANSTLDASSQAADIRALAHELRTPIGSIIALAEMIEREQFGPVGDHRYREYAHDIGDSGRLLLNIVAAGLEQDSIADGLLIDGLSPVDVRGIISSCIRTMYQASKAAEVRVERLLPAELPELTASAPALKQILLNLLANAIKFTPRDGVVTITVKINDAFRISIRDTGVGMNPLDARILTATNEEAQSEQDKRPRVGIGFSLVRRLASAMGAKLDVTSKRGVGTCVELVFPVEHR